MSKIMQVLQREQCIGCYSCMLACSRYWDNIITVEKARLIVNNYPGVEGAFSIRLCYACLDPDCSHACPTSALVPRAGGGVILKEELCIHCQKCVKACVPEALMWDNKKLLPTPCKHCGICAAFCPNEVLGLVER